MNTAQPVNLDLGKQEEFLQSYNLIYSSLLVFLKSTFQVTNKRLIIKVPNVILWVIPLGSKVETYPLRNVSSVVSVFRLKFIKLLFGSIIVTVGLSLMSQSFWGILIALLGLSTVVDSFVLGIVVRAAGGEAMAYRIAFWQKVQAERLANHINQAVVDCSDR